MGSSGEGMTDPEQTEKRPTRRGWKRVPVPPQITAGRDNTHAISVWRCGPIAVISELANMEAPDGDGLTPQWLVSVTADGKRPAQWQVDKVLEDFGMAGAEEDNHFPGKARGFFLVVDPTRRVDCQCKTDETVVVEPDGYTWSRDDSGKPCVGCELAARAGMRCPQHG